MKTVKIYRYLAGYAVVSFGGREIHLRVDGLNAGTSDEEAGRLIKEAATAYCRSSIEEALADIAYYSSVIEVTRP